MSLRLPAILAALLTGAALIGGCSTVRNGGAPTESFKIEDDIKALEEAYGPSASIKKYYEATDKKSARNEFIDGRLALYNIRYIEFIRNLGASKQQLDAANDILLLGLNIAGTLVGSTQAKTNLAAAAALVTGSKTAIDKHFYFEKTVPALIATMNAQRKAVLLKIMAGRKTESVDEYPLGQAIADLYEFEMAGTLLGAIDAIQADASVKGAELDDKIIQLAAATPDEIAQTKKINAAIAALSSNSENLSDINRVLKEIGAPKSDFTSFDEAKKAIRQAFKIKKPSENKKWMSALGI